MYPEIIEFSGRIPLKATVRQVDEYPYHWHNAVEVILALEGKAEITLCGETYLLKENGVAVVNVDEPHRIKRNGGANRLLFMQIDPAFCRRVDPDFDYVLFQCCSPCHEAGAPEKYRCLKEHIARLVRLLPDGEAGPCQEASVKACLEELLAYMTDSFDYLRYGAGTRRIGDRQVRRYRQIYKYIRQQPVVRNSLAELAKAAGITQQHMSNDIRKKYGYSLRQLICSGYCMQAARLLLSTDAMIYEISAECGFSDPKYLIKSFKQFYHCTPSEFRMRHKTGAEGLEAQTRFEDFPLSSAKKFLVLSQNLKSVNASFGKTI
ncbi:AraC family transcriptional regulator [Pelotomaculum terephthalicicum JT]|uniref:AraC family transcriptional regulator n=1 Tax=Pelotomaculum TaxID=191373 RepID=UPI0009CD5F6E|nr:MULTISPECIES: AraC family transcriptional regulator [Pelotomaculum]MCG9967080.1 AraC family transcriptional regulator [Pelotomaculum terephthalicicum JT]OPX89267.1 MAG: HTH-type transcriptional activator Btr [Pelotomaculum sp. PtaB.Bin117]OPY63874.1 MAG: HTH-type transcriptional activator Btr [Pelotomaculum sp. PtaU1.Bin065]